MEDKPKLWYGACGTLLCDREIPGVTRKLVGGTDARYGAPYFVGERMTMSACEKIAVLLGGEFTGVPPKKEENK